MKLAELFNEGTYRIDGPPQGDKLPVTGDNPAVKMYVDLKDKRIDLDNPQGPTISDKIPEINQAETIRNSAGSTITIPAGAPHAGTWRVLTVNGTNLVVVDINDQSPEPAQVNVPAGMYYVDHINNDGTIHLKPERGRAKKHRVATVDLGVGTYVTVQ